ncbi:MAG: hypothetical protein FD173_228 [Gallionellaceae bacterium]|nr:MAG: hypothetical protein FD173_228 [Gallionellaceae bacterium]
MSTKKPTSNLVLLFEDDDKHANKLTLAITQALSPSNKFERFLPSITPTSGAYEDRLYEELKSTKYLGLTLIVCDRDLSQIKTYTGLSEAIVSKVADRLGIPICLYARGLNDDSVLERQREWGDGRIVLDCKKPAEMATKIELLANGFAQVKELVTGILVMRGKNKLQSPAAVVASVIDRQDSTDKIGLYISGDQKMISEILPYVHNSDKKGLKLRLPTLVGYWIYDSILRYPGLLVNKIAIASYLNIAVTDFEKNSDVQKLFAKALYKGPFADEKNPLWWRNDLDDILQNGECNDGQEYVQKKLHKTVKPCMCSVDKKKRAGWYCMVTKKPVSLESSKGNITWFPRGADLARISTAVYDDIGPWLGLY